MTDDAEPQPFVQVTDAEAQEAFGGDEMGPHTPEGAALVWLAALRTDRRDWLEALTVNLDAFGDLDEVREFLGEDWGLSSKPFFSEDRPDDLAYMKIVVGVGDSSLMAFGPAEVRGKHLTLIRHQAGFWQVWGIGPAPVPASVVFGG